MARLSENAVSFFGAGGHKHDGATSSLISTASYSLFDFKPGYIGAQSRISIQQDNQTALEDWVISIVNNKVLSPAGLDLAPGLLSGKSIRANTITATELQANTITADEIAANAVTANELAANLVLVNNVIRSNNYDGTIASNNVITSNGTAGWAITSSGQAEFDNAVLRGNVTANAGSIGGWTINASSITAGSAALYSNGSLIVGNTTIASNGQITNGGYTLSATGALTATGANISGIITSTSGTIGGWTINSTSISGGNTILYSNGYVYAAVGEFKGSLSGASITGATGTFSGTVSVSDGTNGIEITTDGYIKGLGGSGVRIKNSDGSTGTQLFAGSVITSTVNASLLSVSNGTEYFQADVNGARIKATDNRPLDLQRNYVADAHFIRFYKYSGTVPAEAGKIRFANTTPAVAYDVTSDGRLKENIKKIENGISIIMKTLPVEYNYIDSQGVSSHGFIAQDLYEVYDKPVYVGGDDPREDPWSIDYSKMVPVLTAALQEAIAKINDLEARLQAVEGV